ncbi:MAG: hypothetical protein Q7R99_00035 [bacterium]|nr:hypothetical protein [bacterium]
MKGERKDKKVAFITTSDNKLSISDVETKLRECFNNILIVVNLFFLTDDNIQEVWAEVKEKNCNFILVDSELIKNKKWWKFIEKIGGKESIGEIAVSDTDYLLSL